ncbi:hypothetical protein F5B22DRAFT_609194 [Xylaria bambusicola]|uniref:uncharacterized protein n=1 Tax=Xylaria bambusicola TaxID=326684 RepID=UPI00200774E6|nr:uncharacterized protein F5B22DRAFT_609194 [Xylaria bambusicola]KAI0514964.1 hypothetical protein F5B22DRAFT_609194 [Xylaria bambusicola]
MGRDKDTIVGGALIGGALLEALSLLPSRRRSEHHVSGVFSNAREQSGNRTGRYSAAVLPRHEFQYDPLPNPTTQIRLVRIARNLAPGGLIQCELKVIHITDPSYEYSALSYTWGNTHRRRAILLDGGLFQVTENLHRFLEHAIERISATASSSRGNSKWIGWWWIDALCINQSDVYGEKSVQVALMGDIFTRAREVIAWIGEAGDNTKTTFERLRALRASDPATRRRRPSPAERRLLRELQQDSRLSSGIGHMFRKDYWDRMWILQELALSNRTILVCGMYELKWNIMVDFAMKMQLSMKGNPARSVSILGNAQQAVEKTRNVWLISQIYHHEEKSFDLSLLLYLSRYQEAQEAKDRIYALLSLVSPRYKDMIGPPRQNQSSCQLFGHVARIVFKDMQLFRFAEILEQVPDDYPQVEVLCYSADARDERLRRLRRTMERDSCHNPFAEPSHRCPGVDCAVFRCNSYRCSGKRCLDALYRFLESIYDRATVYTRYSGNQQIELGGHEASISRSRSRSCSRSRRSPESERRSRSKARTMPRIIHSLIGRREGLQRHISPSDRGRLHTRGRSPQRRI